MTPHWSSHNRITELADGGAKLPENPHQDLETRILLKDIQGLTEQFERARDKKSPVFQEMIIATCTYLNMLMDYVHAEGRNK